ncbi:MAG: ABC transporter ATP-binding protein [Candidatus Bathyarchaeota archaeon]|uniref:ABC transporter ATP-binding protein n=1 Tax=Candidatus Bathycorpusculum sp. TaxID=2994959 RepID=UPI0028349684|nr:ABC transporter ATP-binding protein [Candidatus Termiticorpusculum sp.]MCL2256776.1 ABC transporter ATP-binding protein [Candidatus Termiticorpusculum sp.]MCL2293157.1 ABC transporter ATP-binding protein [Candidatus Termiticorpusculum sp.]
MVENYPYTSGTSLSPVVLFDSVSSGYSGRKVLENVSFQIDEPAIYVVLGPNGAGKTTLFRTLAGILKPYSGRAEIGGYSSESQQARKQLDYLTHIDGMPEGMSVINALRFYANIAGATETDVQRVINILDLGDLSFKRFGQLSQGQKKRVSVGRIFLKEKKVYLLDEPTSNMDPKMAGDIRDLVLRLSKDKVVLYSSHNLFEAREIGSKVLVIKNGKLALFGNISDIKTEKYTIGVRTLGAEEVPNAFGKEGDYYLFELSGPQEVPRLISKLLAKNVQIREVKEMQNPLEELFK